MSPLIGKPVHHGPIASMAEPATPARLLRGWTSCSAMTGCRLGSERCSTASGKEDGPSRIQDVHADSGRAIEELRGIRTDRRPRDPRWNDTRPSPSSGAAHHFVPKTGLVLVGGGARGAYQAGVLQGLTEIVGARFGDRPPFDVVTGISAGAINAAYLEDKPHKGGIRKAAPSGDRHERADDASLLGRGYSSGQWWTEAAGLAVLGAIALADVGRVAAAIRECGAAAVLPVLVGYLASDFMSGLVHWFGDTWGTVAWPLVGNSLIRGFREHHVDPEAITRHDFVEASGSICTALVPVGILVHLLPAVGVGAFVIVGLATFSVALFATNEIHKWAHMVRAPLVIRWLQRSRIILSPAAHAVHHAAPFDRHYCITTGWLNAPLAAMDFFRRTERLITRLTGAVPRADDARVVTALTAPSPERASLREAGWSARGASDGLKAPGGGWGGTSDVTVEASSRSAASGHSWREGRRENVPIVSR